MNSQQLGVSVAIAVLLAAVFFIDVRTGLGFTPWLLYVIPLGLTYWIASVYSPLMVAAVCIALMFVGYAFSPPLVPPPIALTNRLFGTATFLAIAGLIVAYKLLARRLSLLTDQLRQELFERTQDLGRAVRVLKAEMAIKSRDVPLTDQELGRHLTNVLVVESRRLQEQFGQFEEGKVLSAEHRLEETRKELDRLTKQLEQFNATCLAGNVNEALGPVAKSGPHHRRRQVAVADENFFRWRSKLFKCGVANPFHAVLTDPMGHTGFGLNEVEVCCTPRTLTSHGTLPV
jgi:hypothetical protein